MVFTTTSAYDKYAETLESVGESILDWADPEKQFRGYTEVRSSSSFSC